MRARVCIGAIALLASSAAFADVVTLNTSKALKLYDGGNDPFLLSAWSYNGGTAQENKDNSYKSWISFNDSPLLPQPYLQGAELTLTQWNDGRLDIPSPVTIDLYALIDSTGDSWSKTTVTWATAPGNDSASSSAVDPNKTILAGSMTLSGQFPPRGTIVHLPFNQDGVEFLNNDGDGVFTFILAARDTVGFVTGLDTYTAAQLLVTTPEPTVVGGLFATSLGLLIRKRVKK